MKKFITIFIVVIVFLVGGITIYKLSPKNVEKEDLNENINETNSSDELKNSEETEQTDQETIDTEVIDNEIINSEESTNKKSSNSSNDLTNTNNQTQQEQSQNTTQSSNSQKSEEKSNTSTDSTQNNTETKQNSNEKTAWEKLGISEYDYYHKPAWSWQTVDFVMNGTGENGCSSREDCRNKCITYGENYLLTHDGGYGCDTVNSYSGDYLGEYFEFFELES